MTDSVGPIVAAWVSFLWSERYFLAFCGCLVASTIAAVSWAALVWL